MLRGVQAGDREQRDPSLRKCGENLLEECAVQQFDHCMGPLGDLRELLARSQSGGVRKPRLRQGRSARGHADHEELVEVAGDDVRRT